MKPAQSPTRTRSIVAALISATMLLSACNTISGAGQDLESVGKTVDDAAN